MDDAASPARRERGWRKLLPALAAFLFLPLVPPLCLLFPVEQTLVLIVPAVAACTLAGWRAGGRLSVALFWTLLAVWVLFGLTGAATEFDVLVRGWALALAGAFGVVNVLSAHRTFFVRALSSVGLAGALAVVATASGVDGGSRIGRVLSDEFAQRSQYWATQAAEQARSDDPISRALRERGMGDDLGKVQRLVSDETAVTLFPALLALESLAALGLAWSLYHRFSRVRIGLALAPLREFRFNDQLVWGLVAGLAFVLLEALSGLKAPGINMLVFFGALYALRGTGVLAWFLAPDRLVMVPLFLFALLAWQLFGAVALGLGLGDTWLDWRSRAPRPAA